VPSQEIASYFDKRGYALLASPALYAGQMVRVGLSADSRNGQQVLGTLYLRSYGPDDKLVITHGPQIELVPGAYHELTWQIGDTEGAPIAEIGLEISSEQRADGTVYLDYLTWDGSPNTVFSRPNYSGSMWRRAWVNGVDQYEERWPEAYRLVQNNGRGLFMQGTRAWTDYQVSAAITPHLVKAAGIAARVQGLRRYYALLLTEDGKARLIKALDGETVLAETEFPWRFGETYEFHLQVRGQQLRASINGQTLFTVQETIRPLSSGGIALVCEEGRMATDAVVVRPVE
jgi:hypothetical protein